MKDRRGFPRRKGAHMTIKVVYINDVLEGWDVYDYDGNFCYSSINYSDVCEYVLDRIEKRWC